jgi:methyl-accepting chemotaxis protein
LVENIHDLSSRTRVLALNASIEAVKAGAAGGGFLVVAREIKSLAVKSAGEAEAITETLQEITRDVEESSRDINHVFASVDTAAATSRETGKVLSGTIASFSRIADMVSQIGEDAGIETDHAREIVDTFEIVSKISRNIAGSSENLAAAADRMNVQTNDLRSVVYQFRLRSRPAFTGGSEPDPVPASQVPEASPA